jgi:hypothetical protein
MKQCDMKHIRNIVITIFALLFAGVSATMIHDFFEKKRAESVYPVRQECRNFEDAINLYQALHGSYPSGTNALSIVFNDEDCRKLLKKANLVDPWGTPFRFRIVDGHPVVDSAGRDRKFDTGDDVYGF